MFALAAPAWDIILRTALIYLALLIGLRIAGKREIGQMTVFDLVVLLLLSNAVQNAMLGPDTSLVGGLLAAAVLLALNAILARLGRGSPRLRRLIEGSPTLLILHGRKGSVRRRCRRPCVSTGLRNWRTLKWRCWRSMVRSASSRQAGRRNTSNGPSSFSGIPEYIGAACLIRTTL